MRKQNLRYCPDCGRDNFIFDGIKKYHCNFCGFEYYFNSAAAAVAVVTENDHLLTVVRARDPHEGMLDLPGGFVDPGESSEQALYRELQEELSVRPVSHEYFLSASVCYPYAGVEYSVCEIFYRCKFADISAMRANDDVAEIRWVPLAELDIDAFAFTSAKWVIEKLLREATRS